MTDERTSETDVYYKSKNIKYQAYGFIADVRTLEVSVIRQTQEPRQISSYGECMTFAEVVIRESFGLLSRSLVEMYNPIREWSKISLLFNTAILCS
jgi:hypothetical protein